MISILLLILKIIGFTVLALLALILVLIIIILFVPIHYIIRARKEEVTEGKVHIYWILHIVSTKIVIGEKTNIILRIFGIPIYNKLKKDAKEDNSFQSRKTKDDKNIKNKKNKNKKNTNIKTEDSSSQSVDSTGNNAQYNYKENKNEARSKIGDFLQKVDEFIKKIIGVVKNFKCKILGIYDTIKDVINNIEYYLNLLERDDVLRAITLSKKHLWKLLYSIRPRKFNVKIHLGMEDPETLGKILSYYSAFYPIYTDHIVMCPEFNQSVFEGNLFVKGKITGFVILRTAWVLYFNQDIRRTISLLKREEI